MLYGATGIFTNFSIFYWLFWRPKAKTDFENSQIEKRRKQPRTDQADFGPVGQRQVRAQRTALHDKYCTPLAQHQPAAAAQLPLSSFSFLSVFFLMTLAHLSSLSSVSEFFTHTNSPL
jgi:hypothetical protein